MSRRIIAGLAAAGVALLASCSQDKSPNVSLPTEATFAKTPPPLACSFTTASQDAKNYFTLTSGPSKDQVFILLDAMQSAYTAGGAAGATSAGFDVLARLAAVVGTSAVKSTATAAQGSLFANDVLLCMSVPGFSYAAGQFTDALSPATGLFAVRVNGDLVPIVAKSGRFGAEPTTSAGWPLTGSTTGKALFYGSPLAVGSLFNNDPRVGTVFDLKSLPSPLTFSPKIRVGDCDLSVDGRILHLHGIDPAVVLPISDPQFCPATYTSTKAPSSMFASAAQQLVSWLAPTPAFAASRSMMPVTTKVGGGTVGGLSVIGPIQVVDSIAFQGSVPNASVSDTAKALDADTTTSQFNPIVKVRVVTRGGNALAGVVVTLTVAGNKGSFAASGGSATTDTQGYASFPNFAIDKAGGYTITAQAGEFGTSSFVATSNLFNINGQ
jgi:hypothetical protein